MSFCAKCGKEIDPDGVCDCQKAGGGSGGGRSAQSIKKKSIGTPVILIGILAVTILVIFAFRLLGNKESYETPFQELQKLINKRSTDVFAYQKIFYDPDTVEYSKKSYDILKASDDVKEAYLDIQEELKDCYEDLEDFKITKIEVKKAKKRKLKGSELRDIADEYIWEKFGSNAMDTIEDALEDMDDVKEEVADNLELSVKATEKYLKLSASWKDSMDKVKVQEVYDVTVVVHVKYDGEEEKKRIENVAVYKINGKWIIGNADNFLSALRFFDEIDVDLYELLMRGYYGSAALRGVKWLESSHQSKVATDITNAEIIATAINVTIADYWNNDADIIPIESGVPITSPGGKTVLTRESNGQPRFYLPDSKVRPGAEWTIYFDEYNGVTKILLGGYEIWPDSRDYEENAKR